MDIFGTLQVVVNTLNDIEVKGSDNMSKLLGCINVLSDIIAQSQDEDGEEVNNG